MDFESLSETVKKALEHWDNQNWKYRHLINNQNIRIDDVSNTISFLNQTNPLDQSDNSDYIIKGSIFDCELLGYYDNINSIWVWGWVLADFNYRDTPLCKYLLDYGLRLEPKSATLEQTMIKAILVNSRIKIDESVQLEINLALYSYLIKDRIKFIFGRKKYIDELSDKYVTFYYLLK
jgi:hypothetical protein